MELTHDFTVPAPIEQAWETFMDLERVGGCFPGATVTSVEGDSFSGTVKVKLGPIALQYNGSGKFVERDDANRKAVLEAKGKDRRGNGTAGATVTVHMSPGTNETRIDVTTDLSITGKPAQFGRGVMQDVAGRLVDQFADNLAAMVAAPVATREVIEEHVEPDGSTVETVTVHTPPPVVLPHQGDAIDLVGAAGAPVLKRAIPILAAVAVIGGLVWWLSARRRRA